jgi:hypothetical protein
MKTRSALEICLPLDLFVAACALSLPTLLIAISWMTIGVISLGHHALESFPRDGIRRESPRVSLSVPVALPPCLVALGHADLSSR